MNPRLRAACQSLRVCARGSRSSLNQYCRGLSRRYSQPAQTHTPDAPYLSSVRSQLKYPSGAGDIVADKHVAGSEQALELRLNDRDYHFDGLLLRDSCNCVQCVDPHSRQKNFYTSEIPFNIAIETASVEPDGSVRICWRNDIEKFRDAGHSTLLSPHYLFRLAEKADQATAAPSHFWSGEEFQKRFHLISYDDFMNRKEVFCDAMEELNELGLIILDKVPESEKSVEHIGEQIGPLRDTFYGRTWDVRDKPEAENVAYTSKYLGMHMDLLYMKYPPGLQLLHCIHSSDEGGESMFADSFKAASVLEQTDPEAFESLLTFPVTYHYLGDHHNYKDSKTTIELHKQPLPVHGSKSRSSRIAHVNYSPPFQGPFEIDTATEQGGIRLRTYHRAIKSFAGIVDNPQWQFRRQLGPGECAVFDNRRVLHGRTDFRRNAKNPARPRWLKGTYLDGDVFTSRLAQIRKQS